MTEALYRAVVEATAGLYAVLVATPYFFIDLWSLLHFASGTCLMVALLARRVSVPFGTLLVLLFGYEVVELSLIWGTIHVFRPESLPDQVTDIAIGLFGGVFGRAFWQWWRELAGAERRALVLDAVVAAVTAAAWVASYGYRYNVEALNSRGINWWALLWWSAGLFGLLRIERGLRNSLAARWVRFGATWTVFLAGLLALEFLGYHVLGIRELTEEGPLVLGLVHGPARLKAFYLAAAPLALLVRAALPACGERPGPAPGDREAVGAPAPDRAGASDAF